jgi:hypothetical protein
MVAARDAHRIARKGIESSQRLGRHRWTIERTLSWLVRFRRRHRRCERKAEHFLRRPHPGTVSFTGFV